MVCKFYDSAHYQSLQDFFSFSNSCPTLLPLGLGAPQGLEPSAAFLPSKKCFCLDPGGQYPLIMCEAHGLRPSDQSQGVCPSPSLFSHLLSPISNISILGFFFFFSFSTYQKVSSEGWRPCPLALTQSGIRLTAGSQKQETSTRRKDQIIRTMELKLNRNIALLLS